MNGTTALAAALGLILGALLTWFATVGKRQVAEARARDLQERADQVQAELAQARSDKDQAQQECARLGTQLEQAQKDLETQLSQFKAAASDAMQANAQNFLDLARSQLETIMAKTEGHLGQHQERISGLVQPLQEELNRLEQQVKLMEETRQQAYGSLHQQLGELNRETDALVRTLRAPQRRGAWGELTLRRVVELAGLTEHYDFRQQETISGEEGEQRPDLVVTLPGDRVIVVDAKAPMDAYFQACEAQDEATRKAALLRHSQQVRSHVQSLARKDYAAKFGDHLDLVCLFLPGESFFSAATEQDQELLTWAMERRVLLCSPANLVVLLRTVGLFWQKHAVVENADQIAEASRELFERIRSFVGHVGDVGEALKRAEQAYNRAVGSYQSRVLPAGRRVTELKGARLQAEAPELDGVEVDLRELPAAADEPQA